MLIEDKVVEIKNQIVITLQKKWDVKIADFTNSQEALDCLENDSASIDLILLDLKIPFEKNDSAKRENGEKVLKKLCCMEVHHIIPTIVITAYPDLSREPALFGRKYRIYGYIDKSGEEFSNNLYNCVQEIMNGKEKVRNRFCSIANRVCSRPVRFKGRNSCFLAYSSEGRYAGFMIDLKRKVKDNSIDVLDWLDRDRDFDSPSALIFCPFLCDRIFSRNIFVANITDKNLNVYFELGFAMAIGRKSYALYEKNKIKLLPPLLKGTLCFSYSDLNVFKKFSFDDYLNNNLYGRLTNILPALTVPSNLTISVLTIFPDDEMHEKYIKEKLMGYIKNAEPLYLGKERNIITVLNKILSADKIILDLLSDKEEATLDNNAQLLFLAGFALGRGKKIFLLQQEPIQKSITDVYPILLPYSDINKVEFELEKWASMN